MTKLSDEVQDRVKTAKENGCVVYQIEMPDQVYTYRSLNRFEWKSIQKGIIKAAQAAQEEGNTSDPVKEDGEEDVVIKGCIDPQFSSRNDLAPLPAGIVTTIADAILQASGFGVEAPTPVKL